MNAERWRYSEEISMALGIFIEKKREEDIMLCHAFSNGQTRGV